MLTFIIEKDLNVCIQSNHGPYFYMNHVLGADVTKEMWMDFIKKYHSRTNFTLISTQNQNQYVNSQKIVIDKNGLDFVTKTCKGETHDRYNYDQSLDDFINLLEKHLKIRTPEIKV